MLEKPWKRSGGAKYGARRCEHDGHKFDSEMERDYYLAYLKRYPENQPLVPHPPVLTLLKKNKVSVTWKLDFYEPSTGFFIDVKGAETREFKLKKKLWRLTQDKVLVIVTKSPGLPFPWVRETVEPA